MKESNILGDNVAKNFLTREILQNTEDQLMRESFDIVCNNCCNPFAESTEATQKIGQIKQFYNIFVHVTLLLLREAFKEKISNF